MKQPKPPLLLLVHRIPYPPNKGDKIRSFNLMKALSENFELHLGCFYDDPFDQKYIPDLNHWCKSIYCLKLKKSTAILNGLSGFLTQQPITLPYYFHRKMATWVNGVVQQHAIADVLVYSSSMAQYVDSEKFKKLNRVIDFVDIDSDKWRQYAEKSKGIKRWFYRREARLLQRYEIEICERFNVCLFVSEDEADAFRQLVPASLRSRVFSLLNGVDTVYFSQSEPLSSPALPERYLVFTGAMDYWANVDAVCWFCQAIWPQLRQSEPNLCFLIVGGNPHPKVRALSKYPGVIVTGRVNDIRPYIAQACFAVAPMLIARGIQNKVLEAMAMGKAVVCTTMAMEGINAPLSETAIIADQPESFVAACSRLLQQPITSNNNREWILQNFTWHQTLKPLPSLFADRVGK